MRGALEQGEKLKAMSIARKLLNMKMPLEEIVRLTDLSLEEIEKLR
jgi:hypothetical protein